MPPDRSVCVSASTTASPSPLPPPASHNDSVSSGPASAADTASSATASSSAAGARAAATPPAAAAATAAVALQLPSPRSSAAAALAASMTTRGPGERTRRRSAGRGGWPGAGLGSSQLRPSSSVPVGMGCGPAAEPCWPAAPLEASEEEMEAGRGGRREAEDPRGPPQGGAASSGCAGGCSGSQKGTGRVVAASLLGQPWKDGCVTSCARRGGECRRRRHSSQTAPLSLLPGALLLTEWGMGMGLSPLQAGGWRVFDVGARGTGGGAQVISERFQSETRGDAAEADMRVGGASKWDARWHGGAHLVKQRLPRHRQRRAALQRCKNARVRTAALLRAASSCASELALERRWRWRWRNHWAPPQKTFSAERLGHLGRQDELSPALGERPLLPLSALGRSQLPRVVARRGVVREIVRERIWLDQPALRVGGAAGGRIRAGGAVAAGGQQRRELCTRRCALRRRRGDVEPRCRLPAYASKRKRTTLTACRRCERLARDLAAERFEAACSFFRGWRIDDAREETTSPGKGGHANEHKKQDRAERRGIAASHERGVSTAGPQMARSAAAARSCGQAAAAMAASSSGGGASGRSADAGAMAASSSAARLAEGPRGGGDAAAGAAAGGERLGSSSAAADAARGQGPGGGRAALVGEAVGGSCCKRAFLRGSRALRCRLGELTALNRRETL